MANISETVKVDILEKKEDGSFKHKLPSTSTEQVSGLDEKLESYATKDYVESTSENLNENIENQVSSLDNKINKKVDKELGKGLSTNDYTNVDKAKVDNIPSNPKYSDTIYDDTELKTRIEAVENREDKDTTYDVATTNTDGLMSSADKAKLVNVEQDLATHLAHDVSQGEIHGLRLTDGKLEYFDGLEWQRVRGDGYPVGNISSFSAKSNDKQVTLTWQDSDDVTVTDSNNNVITIAKWKGTKILRKIGSYPVNENDGVLVVDNGVRNQYQTTGFVDTGLVNDTEYFYMAFPYTGEDVYTVDENNRISATPIKTKIYGIEIDEGNSNPETSVTYTDDAVGFTPMRSNNGNFQWGSWESIIKDEFKIRPCVLNNPAKTVNYYLDYDDYTKKETGGASILTGVDGDVMTEFGTDIYTKWTIVGDKHHIQFSIKAFEGATKNAFEVENGYNQFAYYPLLLTQKLYLLLFKNRDSQTALGRGYVDGNSNYTTTGNTNTKGFMFGETTGKQQMKFLGIEDYWGNKYQWIDGLVTNATHNLSIGNRNFNDSGSGYTSHASGISVDTGGYINTIQGGNDKGFIIKGSSGSATTHYCDYGYLDSGRVAWFGGDRSDGSYAGFAQLLLSISASISHAFIGARLMCVNNSKLYIGAYLGTTQSGKLRSVSGTTPSDNKTIGTFRNEARASNV